MIEPWAGLTTAQRILDLHATGLERFGGANFIRKDASQCVDGALGAAFNAELYLENPRHAVAGLPFAAYLLLYLVKGHCFVDGNKRVAWMACVDVLAAMGLGINATEDEAYDFLSQVIDGTVDSGDEISAWIGSRLYALP